MAAFLLAYLFKDIDRYKENRVIRMTGYKVYADLSLIINFIMDAVILWTAGRLTGLEFKLTRILAAALLGAIYAVGFLFYPFNLLYCLPLKIMFSFLLILLAFYPQKWSDLKKAILYFYIISFVAAGAITGLPYLTTGIQEESGLKVFWLSTGIAIALWLGWQGKKYLFAKVIPELLNFMVQIRFDGQEFSGTGFLDTGNMLRDPLTERPVLIAEYAWLKKYLPLDLIKVFDNSSNEAELLSSVADSSWSERLRIIPFSSVGKQNGILLGIRADEVQLNLGNKKICHKNLIVAIYQEKLSREDNYHLLIPAEIVQNG